MITASSEALIGRLLDMQAYAVRHRDYENVLNSYADEVAVFDIVGPLEYPPGNESVRARLEEWSRTFAETGPVSFEITGRRIEAGDHIGFSDSLNHVRAPLKNGEMLDMFWRETLNWRKSNGMWKIVHAHSSVPFDPGTGMALTTLKPGETKGEDAASPATVVRRILQAYETGDRKTAESLIGPDFRFTSPQDDHIDRTTYFNRCWPFSELTPVYDMVKLAVIGEEVFACYECRTKDNRHFRNTELIRVKDGRITNVEVFFGLTVQVPGSSY